VTSQPIREGCTATIRVRVVSTGSDYVQVAHVDDPEAHPDVIDVPADHLDDIEWPEPPMWSIVSTDAGRKLFLKTGEGQFECITGGDRMADGEIIDYSWEQVQSAATMDLGPLTYIRWGLDGEEG